MIKTTILPADTYIVINKTVLSDQDRKLLIMLYQPIIGTIATNLYFTLWSYLDRAEIISEVWTHHHLITNMGLKLSDIVEAREKLEAIGLIKTYLKKGDINNYAYILYSPMNAYDFLNNPILNTALYSNIGDKEYQNTVEYFKIPKIKLNDFEDVSCSFNEIFESSSLYNVNNLDIRKLNKNELDINYKLDLNNVLSLIPEDMLNYKTVKKETRELINKLSFIYNLNDDEMTEIIRDSINEKKEINLNRLRETCRNYYSFNNSGKLPSLIYRTQPEYLRKPIGDNSNRAKMIYIFETISPYDFLCSKYGNAKPSKSDLGIVEYLLIDLALKPGVVNVLVDYVLKINNNKLTKNFIEAIGAQWKKSKVETVEDAMNLAIKEMKTRREFKENKMTAQKKTTQTPDWFDKEIKTSEVEDNELEKILSEFRWLHEKIKWCIRI